jgi:hypothetical protein
MDLSHLYNEDMECNYISKYGNIIESNGPHDTLMVLNNPKRQVSYFDIEPILLILSNVNNDYTSDYRNDIYTFYGKIESFNYRITINLKSSIMEFINTDINISENFETVDIPEVKYPIYQYTSNPTIITTSAFVAACNVAFADSNNIIETIDILSNKIEDDEDYCVDESIILLLSVYRQNIWYQQKDIMNIISQKINENSGILAELEMEKMENTKSDNVNVLYSSSITRIKQIKKILCTYMYLEEIMKTFKSTDEIMELKLGKHSHFLIRKHNTIMTIKKDEFNTIKLESISDYLDELYNNINIKYIDVIKDFNVYCSKLSYIT